MVHRLRSVHGRLFINDKNSRYTYGYDISLLPLAEVMRRYLDIGPAPRSATPSPIRPRGPIQAGMDGTAVRMSGGPALIIPSTS